ncbi:MAG: nuclear transport factor 2 family protein [Gammaproteobacteria bacterium]
MVANEIWQAVTLNYATYARACDEKRYDLLTAVFCPDATLAYHVAGHDFSCRGDEAEHYFSGFLARCYWTHHLIAHPTVEFDGERVRASARVTATHLQRRSDGSTNRWLVRGSYHDLFVRRDSRWLIATRHCHCLDAEGDFEATGIDEFANVAWAGRDVLG